MACHCASAMNGKAPAVIKSSKCMESKHSYKEEKDPKKGADLTELVCMEKAYCTLLSELGENTEREGLLRTPLRAARRRSMVSTVGGSTRYMTRAIVANTLCLIAMNL